MVVSDDAKNVFVAAGQTLHAIDGEQGEQIWEISEPTGPVKCMLLFERKTTGNVLYTCSNLRTTGTAVSTIRAYHTRDGDSYCKHTFREIAPASIISCRDRIVVGCSDGSIHMLTMALQHIIVISGQHTETVSMLSADENCLFSSSTGPVVMTKLGPLCQHHLVLSGKVELLNADGAFNAAIEAFRSFKLPMIQFVFALGLMIVTSVQLSTFAFSKHSLRKHRVMYNTLKWLRIFHISGKHRFIFIFCVVCVVAAIFITLFLLQEKVEWRRFINPDTDRSSVRWTRIWLSLNFFSHACSTVLFMHIANTLLQPWDCTYSDEYGKWFLDVSIEFAEDTNGSIGNREEMVYDDDQVVVCYKEFGHWILMLIAAPIFVIYTLFAGRLMRADADLQNVELRSNLLDWSGDSQPLQPYVHALSPRSAMHSTLTVVIKTIVVFVNTLWGTVHPVSMMGVMLLASIALCAITVRHPPFFGPGGKINAADLLTSWPNRLRCGMDLTLLCCFGCSMVDTILDKSRWSSETNSDHDWIMMRVFPISAPLLFLFGYYVVPMYMLGVMTLRTGSQDPGGAASRLQWCRCCTKQQVESSSDVSGTAVIQVLSP